MMHIVLPVLTQLFFPKPPTTFLTCFCRGERRKYARKKVRLNRGWNSQPPGHESDTLTTEPPGQGEIVVGLVENWTKFWLAAFSSFPTLFSKSQTITIMIIHPLLNMIPQMVTKVWSKFVCFHLFIIAMGCALGNIPRRWLVVAGDSVRIQRNYRELH